MKTMYLIEFYYNEEVIDWKESHSPLIIPRVGEEISILSWENPDNSEGILWWKVDDIKHIIFKNPTGDLLTQKILIYLTPSLNK